MGNRYVIGISIGVLLLCGITIMVFANKKNNESVRIGACPTFWDMLYSTDLLVRETQSTSESLHFLKGGYVEYVLAGRTPKPGEFQGDYQILGSGYSFLHKQSITISDTELQTMNFYTDLDDLETIKKIFGIKKLERVESIYDYSNENIIITSREKTEYSKADVVHVLHTNGERYIESRIPILYCKEKCDNKVLETIKQILSTNSRLLGKK